MSGFRSTFTGTRRFTSERFTTNRFASAVARNEGVWGPSWVPNGATLALDYANDRYWSKADGDIADPTICVRASSAWRTATDGKTIAATSSNVLRRDSRGAYLCGFTRSILTAFPTAPASWAANGSPTRTTLTADGSFTPQRVESAGSSANAIRENAAGRAVTAGDIYTARVLYKTGTSGRVRAALRRVGASGTNSIMAGPVDAVASSTTGLGTWTNIQNRQYGDLSEVTAQITIASSQTDVTFEVGPDSATVGEGVIVYGGFLAKEVGIGEYALGSLVRDDISVDDASIPEVMTLVADFVLEQYPSGASTATILHCGDATDYVQLQYEVSSGKYLCKAVTGGVEQCSLDLGAVTLSASHRVAFAFRDNYFAASIDGNTAVEDTSGTAPSGMSAVYLGQNSAGANGATVRPASLFVLKNWVAPASLS